MKHATEFYIKQNTPYWNSEGDDVSMADYLLDHKFYVKGGKFKKKLFDIMIWLMKKLDIRTVNLNNEPRNMVYKKYRFDQFTIEKLIKKYRIDLEYVWHEKPRYLVMGQNVFQELFNDVALNFSSIETEFRYNVAKKSYDSFDDYNSRDMGYEREVVFWGFTVLIVPWINGCFLLPNI